MHVVVTEEVLGLLGSEARMMDRLAMVYAALVASLHNVLGMEFGMVLPDLVWFGQMNVGACLLLKGLVFEILVVAT